MHNPGACSSRLPLILPLTPLLAASVPVAAVLDGAGDVCSGVGR